MKLLFYSGGCEVANERMDEELYAMIEQKRSPRMTYIPSCSWGVEQYYKEVKNIYIKRGFVSVDCFPIDTKFTQKELDTALRADVVYLSGGNTYYFLKQLREGSLLPKLKQYVARDGILMGLSAGSIIMTPSIGMAGIPRFDCDQNDVKLKNLKSLGLVPFEFSPHYNGRKKVDEELLRYSKKIEHPLYACPDGDGIIINGDKVSFIGEVYPFVKGKKYSSI